MTEQHLEHSIFGDAEHRPPPHPPRVRRSQRRRRRGRRLLVLVVAIAIVAAAGVGAFTVLRPVVASLTAGNDYPGPGTGTVQVTVHDGDSGRAIAAALQKAGVVKTPKAFLDAAAADPRSASIQPGTYALRQKMSGKEALAVLVDPKNRTVPRVTIREGLWMNETFAALSKGTGTPVADYERAAKDPAALGLPAAAKGNLEGWLFPSTYEFPDKASAAEQLRTMVAKTASVLAAVGVPGAEQERTLVVASIVEGEVSGQGDRGKVARVIENRLRTSGPPTFGLLQMDSTVHYAVHQRGRAGTTDADRRSTSPYNTYRHKGLPPAPINSPGEASIRAAAHPTPGPWLFFVTVNPDTGETRFATTKAEHDRYAALFNSWCKEHSDRC